MKDFRDKVAVITGSASGIGRAIAQRCAQEGMKVVLADIEKSALTKTADELAAGGATVLAVQTDVADSESVEALARQALVKFGAVHLLVNNAGVAGGNVATGTQTDWEWVLGVNLWGVIHGVRVFTPIMLRQNTEAHIVNTASVAGLLSGGLGIYTVSKHAVVALSETLYHELAAMDTKLKVSVLCPGWVRTQIGESARNRPPELQNRGDQTPLTPQAEAARQALAESSSGGIPPEQVADFVFDAIKNGQFYILTHPDEFRPAIQLRMEDILRQRNPTNRATSD